MRLNGTIGFLGYGNMGSAILGGLLAQSAIAPSQAWVYDTDPARCDAGRSAGAMVAADPQELASQSNILILAVKPQTMADALAPVRDALRPKALVISIAAGISMEKLKGWLGEGIRMVRVMPNTPALAQAGAAGLAFSPECSACDQETARRIFEAVGIAVTVQEEDIDAVTALSGSGPAYFFYMTECLAQAAIAEGLDAETAARLAAQTLFGAGKLLVESGESPSTLRERVTSKGGTTQAALEQFRADGFAEGVKRAVQAAAARSRELGR